MDASTKSGKRSTHQWNAHEDGILIQCCLDLKDKGGWNGDNGTFRPGYLVHLEKAMAEKIPNCQIKGTPHIQSRLKTLKSQYREISKMLGNAASGFGWDDMNKCVTCDIEVWNGWVKSHPGAAGLRNKPFPYLDQLGRLFGKDRATGAAVEGPAEAIENMQAEE
ncbi:Myb/SANT-like domain-containing protein, partial [Dioscorea alata]